MTTAAARLGGGRNELLLASVAAYLHRATAAPDLTLGVPTMSRLGSSALRTPGTTSNIVPLRLTVTPGTTAAELVGAVATELRQARRHQQYRVEDLRRDHHMVGAGRRLFGPVVNLIPFDDEPPSADTARPGTTCPGEQSRTSRSTSARAPVDRDCG